MKLLNHLPSVIEKEQLKNLTNFLLEQADLRQIVWDTVLDDKIKDIDQLVLKQIAYSLKYDYNTMKKQQGK